MSDTDALARAAARAEQILVYGLPADDEMKSHMHDVVDVVNELRRLRWRVEDSIKILNDGFKAPEEMRELALATLRGER
jgi:hypothetical protein